MQFLIALLLSSSLGPARHVSGCGLTFAVPSSWEITRKQATGNRCVLGIRPANWKKLIARSRWHEEANAINITVFRTSFDRALPLMEFERDHAGNLGIGVGSRWGFAKAVEVKYPHFSGLHAEPMFRGFAKDGAKLNNESRLYSGQRSIMLLHGTKGLVVGIEYNEWSPDIKIDREAAADLILSTLQPENLAE